MIPERGSGGPFIKRNDVFVAVRVLFRGKLGIVGDDPIHIPELPEIAAALVGRILAPEQFLAELVIQPGEVGLDERGIGFEQRYRVRRDELEVGKK